MRVTRQRIGWRLSLMLIGVFFGVAGCVCGSGGGSGMGGDSTSSYTEEFSRLANAARAVVFPSEAADWRSMGNAFYGAVDSGIHPYDWLVRQSAEQSAEFRRVYTLPAIAYGDRLEGGPEELWLTDFDHIAVRAIAARSFRPLGARACLPEGSALLPQLVRAETEPTTANVSESNSGMRKVKVVRYPSTGIWSDPEIDILQRPGVDWLIPTTKPTPAHPWRMEAAALRTSLGERVRERHAVSVIPLNIEIEVADEDSDSAHRAVMAVSNVEFWAVDDLVGIRVNSPENTQPQVLLLYWGMYLDIAGSTYRVSHSWAGWIRLVLSK